MRVGPCFAALAPSSLGTGCRNQLRLIVQEVKVVDGKSSAFDSGLHLFYSLSRAELKSLGEARIDLRIAKSNKTDIRLGGLRPHPIMTSQVLHGAMATGVRQLILGFAGAKNLTRVARMNSTDN